MPSAAPHVMTNPARYTTVSLFSGAGGMDAGLERTGRFEVLACVERQAPFADTLEANRDAGNLGSPDTLRWVDVFRPKFFLMENVRGLLSPRPQHPPTRRARQQPADKLSLDPRLLGAYDQHRCHLRHPESPPDATTKLAAMERGDGEQVCETFTEPNRREMGGAGRPPGKQLKRCAATVEREFKGLPTGRFTKIKVVGNEATVDVAGSASTGEGGNAVLMKLDGVWRVDAY